MNRSELLEIVRANKEKHVAEFLEAIEDYKKLVLTVAQVNHKLARTGDLNQIRRMKTLPSAPTSYEDSYKRSIRMLELSVDDVIEVEEDIFNQLVLDEWTWKRTFMTTNTMYKSGLS